VDDLWARDTLPTFLVPAASAPAGTPALGAAHFVFNGWGNKQAHAKDALLAKEVATLTGAHLVPSGLVGEGGGIETYVIFVADHPLLPHALV
jgi:agmatine deiminase